MLQNTSKVSQINKLDGDAGVGVKQQHHSEEEEKHLDVQSSSTSAALADFSHGITCQSHCSSSHFPLPKL